MHHLFCFEPGGGTAVAFVDGTAGATIWSEVRRLTPHIQPFSEASVSIPRKYSFTKPQLNGSADSWGQKLNTNLDNLDTLLFEDKHFRLAISDR